MTIQNNDKHNHNKQNNGLSAVAASASRANSSPADGNNRLENMARLPFNYRQLNVDAIHSIIRIAQNSFEISLAGIVIFNGPTFWMKTAQGRNLPEMDESDPFCQFLSEAYAGYEVVTRSNRHKRKTDLLDLKAQSWYPNSVLYAHRSKLSGFIASALVNSTGKALGILFLLDEQVRKLLPHESQIIADLASMLERELNHLESSQPALVDSEQLSVESWCMDFALSHPSVGVWEAQPEQNKINWDQRMRFLFRLRRHQLIESWDDWLELVAPEHRAIVEQRFAEYRQGSDPGVIRFRLDSKQVCHIECRGSHYYDEQGFWRSTIGTCRDVTEQVLGEIALKQKTKLAVRALEVKSNFIACMSHEIRTPMNGVLGVIDLLSRSPLTETQREHLEIAKKSGQHLVMMMNDILDFSKLDSESSVEFEVEEFDLADELIMTFESLKPFAMKKNLDYALKNQLGDHYKVKGSPSRTRQLLNNLISNAIKFTQSGFVNIELTREPVSDCYEIEKEVEERVEERVESEVSHEWVHFSVEDSGIGISDEHIGSLFQMFTQVDSSSTREYGGTGIGLAIVKQILSKLSGEIHVTSKVGEGSRFYGKFLVESVDLVDIEPASPSTLAFNFEEVNLLLVEDIHLNQVVATIMLEEMGIEPVIASNGEEAISILKNSAEPFDFIFMDCEMPIMDGFTATEQIREGVAGDQYKDIAIVALTAHVSDEQRNHAKQSGMNGFISKPISQESVSGAIKEQLEAR